MEADRPVDNVLGVYCAVCNACGLFAKIGIFSPRHDASTFPTSLVCLPLFSGHARIVVVVVVHGRFGEQKADDDDVPGRSLSLHFLSPRRRRRAPKVVDVMVLCTRALCGEAVA